MSFLRVAVRSVARPHAVSAPFRSAQLANARYTFALQRASYSAAAGLSRSDIESRVLDVLKSFEKVNQTKVCRLRPLIPILFLTAPSPCLAHCIFFFHGRSRT